MEEDMVLFFSQDHDWFNMGINVGRWLTTLKS